MKINHREKFVWIRSDNKFYNQIANLKASLIYISNVKLKDTFFYCYTFNQVKIFENIVNTMAIFLVCNQSLLLEYIMLKMLLEKLFQLLVIHCNALVLIKT